MRGLIYILKYLKHLKQGLVYTKCSVNINYSDNSKGDTTIKVTVTKYLHLIDLLQTQHTEPWWKYTNEQPLIPWHWTI